MRQKQTRSIQVAQAIVGVLLAPAIWPLGFIGLAIYSPGSIDPLLGGLQYVLYWPALFWLLAILLVTLGLAKTFHLKVTNAFFLITGAICALAFSAAVCGYAAWGDYATIGAPGVIHPDHLDLGYEAGKFAGVAVFSIALTLVTTAAFVGLGALRVFQPRP